MRERPLSPHISVYRWGYTMTLSILSRATGIALTAGLLVLAYWLMALATGPSAYAGAKSLMSSVFVKILLAGWLFSFVYHLVNGIRHLVWDFGIGLEKSEARRSAGVTVGVTVVLCLVLGYMAFFARGAA